jgi:flagellar hook-associated protein 2
VTTSLSGMASGLDTTSLINSLMQVESAPQTALKTKVSTITTSNSAYTTVNNKMKALLTAAQDLTNADTWNSAKATSSSPMVVATAATGAQVGDLTFSVGPMAAAQRSTVAFASADTPAVVGDNVSLTIGTGDDAVTTSIDIPSDANTPAGVAAAINQAGLSVRASVVTAGDKTILQLSSTKSGAANAFSVDWLTETPVPMTPAADATLTVGDPTPGAGGYTITSSSNTFTGVLPGVTITATAPATNVTVGVVTDTDAIATKMQALVDAANGALAQIGVSAAAGTAAATGAAPNGGPLAGDYTVRQLSGKMLSAISNGQPGFGSFKQLGIELTQDGKFKFSKDNFLTAYNADPAKVQDAVSTGVAQSLQDVANAATDSTTGTLTLKIQSGTSTISRLNKEITDWDTKLSDRKTALQRQFTAMETAMSKVQSQSSWLSSNSSASAASSSSSS